MRQGEDRADGSTLPDAFMLRLLALQRSGQRCSLLLEEEHSVLESWERDTKTPDVCGVREPGVVHHVITEHDFVCFEPQGDELVTSVMNAIT